MEEDKPPLKSLHEPRKIVKTQKTFTITEMQSFFSNFMSSRIPTPSIISTVFWPATHNLHYKNQLHIYLPTYLPMSLCVTENVCPDIV